MQVIRMFRAHYPPIAPGATHIPEKNTGPRNTYQHISAMLKREEHLTSVEPHNEQIRLVMTNVVMNHSHYHFCVGSVAVDIQDPTIVS